MPPFPHSTGIASHLTAVYAPQPAACCIVEVAQQTTSTGCGARTRAGGLTCGSRLGARAHPPRLPVHGPGVRLVLLAQSDAVKDAGDPRDPARDRGLASARRPPEARLRADRAVIACTASELSAGSVACGWAGVGGLGQDRGSCPSVCSAGIDPGSAGRRLLLDCHHRRPGGDHRGRASPAQHAK